jgi:hypothetical protein
MKPTHCRFKTVLCGLILIPLACASTSYIDVRYQVPPVDPSPAVSSIYLLVEDQRPSGKILNPPARDKMPNFRDLFALSLARTDDPGKISGVYDLTGLFYAAIQHRLRQRGVTVVEQHNAEPLMQVSLNDFRLELNDRTWTAHIAYRVKLSQDEQRVAYDTITGSAERARILGRGAAEKVMGDIFTDVINRLDLDKLFQNAGLSEEGS